MAKYKITLDKEECIGCGACTVIAPNLFKLEDEGKCIIIKPEINNKDHDLAVEAAESCPVECIHVEEE